MLSWLKSKRKAAKAKKADFDDNDENALLVVVIKLLESQHVQALSASKKDNMMKYVKEFLPLAIEFYKNHAETSDVALAN